MVATVATVASQLTRSFRGIEPTGRPAEKCAGDRLGPETPAQASRRSVHVLELEGRSVPRRASLAGIKSMRPRVPRLLPPPGFSLKNLAARPLSSPSKSRAGLLA